MSALTENDRCSERQSSLRVMQEEDLSWQKGGQPRKESKAARKKAACKKAQEQVAADEMPALGSSSKSNSKAAEQSSTLPLN